MKVQNKHLVGRVRNIPLELLQEMCDEQVSQGNQFDPYVFSNNMFANKDEGGFDWCSSKKGIEFWEHALASNECSTVFTYGEVVNVSNFENERYRAAVFITTRPDGKVVYTRLKDRDTVLNGNFFTTFVANYAKK